MCSELFMYLEHCVTKKIYKRCADAYVTYVYMYLGTELDLHEIRTLLVLEKVLEKGFMNRKFERIKLKNTLKGLYFIVLKL